MGLTTKDAVVDKLGGDLTSETSDWEVHAQHEDYRGNFTKDQVWLNDLKTDRYKLLKDLIRNVLTVSVVVVKRGVSSDLMDAKNAVNETVYDVLTDDPTWGGLTRNSRVLNTITDGGAYAPKGFAVTKHFFELTYFTED